MVHDQLVQTYLHTIQNIFYFLIFSLKCFLIRCFKSALFVSFHLSKWSNLIFFFLCCWDLNLAYSYIYMLGLVANKSQLYILDSLEFIYRRTERTKKYKFYFRFGFSFIGPASWIFLVSWEGRWGGINPPTPRRRRLEKEIPDPVSASYNSNLKCSSGRNRIDSLSRTRKDSKR